MKPKLYKFPDQAGDTDFVTYQDYQQLEAKIIADLMKDKPAFSLKAFKDAVEELNKNDNGQDRYAR